MLSAQSFCFKFVGFLISFFVISCRSFSIGLPYADLVRVEWFGERGLPQEDLLRFWEGDERPSHIKEEELLWLVALRQAYPKVVERMSYQDKGWALHLVNRDILFWEGGRLLPAGERKSRHRYTSLFGYHVVNQLYDSRARSPVLQERLRRRYASRPVGTPTKKTPLFWAQALYGSIDPQMIRANLEEVFFLGYDVKVHSLLVEPLARVERAIREASERQAVVSQEMAAFRCRLDLTRREDGQRTIGAFTWRTIVGSSATSYHSFAVAIDFLPTPGEPPTYWQSARDERGLDWVRIAPQDRFLIPTAIVKAFEDHDFLWGGKWVNWDTQHFEYRPELYRFQSLKADWEDFLNFIF